MKWAFVFFFVVVLLAGLAGRQPFVVDPLMGPSMGEAAAPYFLVVILFVLCVGIWKLWNHD